MEEADIVDIWEGGGGIELKKRLVYTFWKYVFNLNWF